MNIHFYLDDSEQTEITAFHNITSNPFKLGDVVHLNIHDLHPVDWMKYQEQLEKELIESKEFVEKFHLKNIKLKKELKFISCKLNSDPKLTIEYFCTFHNE